MTSPDDQLGSIFSQIASEDQVDPAVFDQTLEAAFDHDGAGFDELIPDSGDNATDTDSDGDDLLGGDLGDAFLTTDDTDSDTSDTEPTDYTDTPIDGYTPDDIDI